VILRQIFEFEVAQNLSPVVIGMLAKGRGRGTDAQWFESFIKDSLMMGLRTALLKKLLFGG
jgi:hypothetical protein